MSRKVSKPMKDENPDLQKQIGCIHGFFQLFDRHRFLTGQRTTSNPPGGGSEHTNEHNITMQKAKEKNVKTAREKQQFSTESSITSMSTSSCSSSMSSVEFNRTIQVEPPSIPQMKNLAEIPSLGQKSIDLHDDIKKSQGLSVKTEAKEGKKRGHTLKHIDSPRPFQTPKSVNTAGVMVAKEPLHILAKSQKTPWDSPRLSYDGRDVQDSFRSTVRNKELPRLSLDSREGSIRSLNEGNKSRSLLKGPWRGYGSPTINDTQLQEPETSRRQSSVVAKLMGLEALPDCTQTCETSSGNSCFSTNKNEFLARLSTSVDYKQHQSFGSPRKCNGSSLPQSRRADSTVNGALYSRLSPEQTPWKQPSASQGSQLPASKRMESALKASNSSHSVYGEIEKRLADLEFKKSGKDLRALKQILEAMQRYKESLDTTRDQASNCSSDDRNNNSPNEKSKVQSPNNRQEGTMSVTVERSNSPQGSKLPIVIMKPAKVKRKTSSPASPDMSIHGKSGLSELPPSNPRSGRLVDKQTAKSITPKIRQLHNPFSQPPHQADTSDKMRTSKLMQASKIPQDSNGENSSAGNKTGSASPRMNEKFDLERRSLPASSSSSRRQHNRQSIELSSPRTTPRQKFSTSQDANECFSKIISPRRDFKENCDAISPDFEGNRKGPIHSDIEVIHTDQSEKISSTFLILHGLNEMKAAKGLSRENSMTETTVIAEQPSPVSVLDATFYREDPPSPINRKSEISKDSDEDQDADDREENSVDLTSITTDNINNQNLVQTVQKFDCTHDKPINFNELLCDSKDPDHKYISEILFASGLLSGPSSSQTVQSPHLNNTKLFLALEQIRKSRRLYNIENNAKTQEQMQRELIVDVVCDMLVQKLILGSSYSQCFVLPNEPTGTKLSEQQLLYDICTEVDKLQHKNKKSSMAHDDESLTSLLWGDFMQWPSIWTNGQREIPDIVLDIERLIFKDLITEVVRGEVAPHPGKHCRQLLFLK